MPDYAALGLKCGIEIHQQLDTQEKLFCGCPTRLRDVAESSYEFFRYLRPTVSELGEVDRAALEESKVKRKFVYKAYDTTCLVENDEEPPRELNQEALDITLQIAKLLNMRIADEVHTMRKIVIDGSNTSGFQRTALVATDGYIETSEGRVGVGVLCLEEEACQKIEEKNDSVVYSLDRLGIPLVEIGTAPDIISPAHARSTAEKIGLLLRATGRVKRGIGTIRQDLNVSIAGGARVEVKGVQELGSIDIIVEREVERQVNLLRIRDELNARGAAVCSDIIDVSSVFAATKSTVIQKAQKDGKVLAVKLEKFNGIVGREVQPGRRLGTELSDRAKRYGVGGIFHTDELPKYGITEDEVSRLRAAAGAGTKDCVVMVAAAEEKAMNALKAVIERAVEALERVPEETRRALPDGSSAYMRPLPGAARMYPETDVPPVQVPASRIDSIVLPELLEEKKARYMSQFGLNEELAWQMARSAHSRLFEDIMDAAPGASPTIIVRTLETTLAELAKEGVKVELIGDERLRQTFTMLSEGALVKEAIPGVLRRLAEKPGVSATDAAAELSGAGDDAQKALEEAASKLIQEKKEFIKEREMAAVSPLMGVLMKEFRGKVSGQVISDLLKEKIKKALET
ncbi:MAG TPA: Glu-tRNA(Gln) amidotransferase subunit GatE [Candidatus Methanoperedenaceae archaeon]|nr:Glu-tRNA(Gln) amidotransferase subunit GatE [Candidatus Methanoperedenaceae archaeon]